MKMQPSTLRLMNLLLFCTIFVVSAFAFFAWLELQPLKLAEPNPKTVVKLPASFEPTQEQLKAIGPPFVALDMQTLKIALPDLRNVLMYYGSNVRPDVSEKASIVQIGFRGSPQPTPVSTTQRIYLKYEPKTNGPKWSISENNNPTSTWLEIFPKEAGGTDVKLFMIDSDERIIQEPPELASFSLAQMHLPFNAHAGTPFEINGMRVDGSLLLRQKCAWYGKDLFLQQYGGESYAFSFEKERLDFLDPENRYSCFVGAGDCLAFIDGRWREVKPGPETQGKPLLVARKVDDRNLSFDLWDPTGKIKLTIELHKAPAIQNFASRLDIKLVGARSKRDWIAEVGKKRMFLRADDWLLFSGDTWHKISTAQELDDYVNGKSRGLLLALEGTEKVGNDVGLIGSLFDESRTQQLPVRITLFKSWEKSASRDEDDDEDDDDEDDEDDDDDLEIDVDDDDEDEDDDEDVI